MPALQRQHLVDAATQLRLAEVAVEIEVVQRKRTQEVRMIQALRVRASSWVSFIRRMPASVKPR